MDIADLYSCFDAKREVEQCTQTHPPLTELECLSAIGMQIAELISIMYTTTGQIAPAHVMPNTAINGLIYGIVMEKVRPEMAERFITCLHAADRDDFIATMGMLIDHRFPLIPKEFSDAFRN